MNYQSIAIMFGKHTVPRSNSNEYLDKPANRVQTVGREFFSSVGYAYNSVRIVA